MLGCWSSVLNTRGQKGALIGPACALLAVVGIAAGLAFVQGPAESNGARVARLDRLGPHQHGPMQLHRRRDEKTVESYNWAGYALSTGQGAVTNVKGSWVVPAATNCPTSTPPAEGPYAAFWVGIDGWSSNTVEQIGTDSDCVNLADTAGNTPTYYAWYEFYPKYPYYLVCQTSGQGCVYPNDVIFAQVSESGSKRFTVYIADYGPQDSHNQTPVWTYSTTSSVAGAKQSSAEWIAETPYGCATANKYCLLTDFQDNDGVADYGAGQAPIPNAVTGSATVNGVTAALGSSRFSNSLQQSTMVTDPSGNPMATPSGPLAPSEDGGDTSFTVTWENVGP